MQLRQVGEEGDKTKIFTGSAQEEAVCLSPNDREGEKFRRFNFKPEMIVVQKPIDRPI